MTTTTPTTTPTISTGVTTSGRPRHLARAVATIGYFVAAFFARLGATRGGS